MGFQCLQHSSPGPLCQGRSCCYRSWGQGTTKCKRIFLVLMQSVSKTYVMLMKNKGDEGAKLTEDSGNSFSNLSALLVCVTCEAKTHDTL